MDDPTESDGFGPAMSALSERHRAFVRAVLDKPTATGEAHSRAAGFENSPGGHRVQAHRLMHDPRVLAAIHEETENRARFGGTIGISGLVRIASDPEHPFHFKACVALADRGGFGVVSKQEIKVEHSMNRRQTEELALRLAADMKVDPRLLLGMNSGEVIEGEVVGERTPDPV